MESDGPPGELHPIIIREHHEEKLAVGFQDTRSFGEGFDNAGRIEVVDGIAADDGFESGWLEGELAHIAWLDGDSLFNARGGSTEGAGGPVQ